MKYFAAAAAVIGLALSARAEGEMKIFSGLNLTDGNSETLTLNAGINASVTNDGYQVLSDGLFSYGETEGERSMEKFDGNGQYNITVSDRWYVTPLKLTYLYDDFADVDYRVVASGGPGYYFIKNDAVRLAAEVGLAYKAEKVADVSDDVLAFRLSERFKWKISPSASVKQDIEYVPTADDIEDYILNASAGMDLMINSSISFNVLGKLVYDNTPAPDREKSDTQLIFGLAYKL